MANRKYRCPHCQSVETATPVVGQKLVITCRACGGRFRIAPPSARQRKRSSTAHSTVKKQVAQQTEAARSESQRATLAHLLNERRLGDYDILDELGRGGMGVVFKAFHRHLKRIMALKVIIPERDNEETLTKRFKREAELHARLSHPNIVHIYDYGLISGVQYFAMDFVVGTSLTTLIGSPEFVLEKRVHVLRQVAAALEHAHQHGVIHRDIKPDNVIVDAGWHAHLVDFGIAKPTNNDGLENITRQGLAVGTPHYMAPEQFRPKLGECGPLSDVYSLGALAYHTMAGHPPYEADTAHGVLILAATTEAMHLAGRQCVSEEVIDEDLGAIIRLAMQKSPADRYPSSKALHDDLERWLLDDEVEARPLGKLMRWQRRLKKKPGRLRTFGIAAGGFTTVCLTFSVGLLTLRNRLTATKIELADIPDSTESNALSGFSSGLSHMTELVDTLLAIGIASTTLLILLGGYFYVLRTARLEHLSSGRQDTLPTEIGTTADEV
ncbi:MAG: serine/threonine-protein kinase [Myxococcota bacterium]|nr:serine/threonine-protein kinase [Myxococcota bacterium]